MSLPIPYFHGLLAHYRVHQFHGFDDGSAVCTFAIQITRLYDTFIQLSLIHPLLDCHAHRSGNHGRSIAIVWKKSVVMTYITDLVIRGHWLHSSVPGASSASVPRGSDWRSSPSPSLSAAQSMSPKSSGSCIQSCFFPSIIELLTVLWQVVHSSSSRPISCGLSEHRW